MDKEKSLMPSSIFTMPSKISQITRKLIITWGLRYMDREKCLKPLNSIIMP